VVRWLWLWLRLRLQAGEIAANALDLPRGLGGVAPGSGAGVGVALRRAGDLPVVARAVLGRNVSALVAVGTDGVDPNQRHLLLLLLLMVVVHLLPMLPMINPALKRRRRRQRCVVERRP